MPSLEVGPTALVSMAAPAAGAVAVVLHRWIPEAHDLGIAVAILDQHRELLGLARGPLGLVVALEDFAGVADGGH